MMITSKTDWPVYPVITRDDPEQLELAARFGRECSGAQRDNVDMIVPSHYSAAPSGDLCTTWRFLFVVRGESRRSVPITGERPPPFRPAFPGLVWPGRVWPGRMWPGRVWPGRAPALIASPVAAECSSPERRFAASNAEHPFNAEHVERRDIAQQWDTARCASVVPMWPAKAAAGAEREQMKHGAVNTVRERLQQEVGARHASARELSAESQSLRSQPTRSEPTKSQPTKSQPTRSEPTESQPTRSQPRHRRRDNFPRNSFFT